MRILLDEQLNWRLTRAFGELHEVRSVRGMGWTGKKNGDLLSVASSGFDVMVTMDKHIEHQQNLPQYDIAVILLLGLSNRLEDTEGFVPKVERLLLEGVEPGRLYRVAR